MLLNKPICAESPVGVRRVNGITSEYPIAISRKVVHVAYAPDYLPLRNVSLRGARCEPFFSKVNDSPCTPI